MRVKDAHHRSKAFTKEMAWNLVEDIKVINQRLKGVSPSLRAETVDKMLKALNTLDHEAREILAEVSC